MRPHRLLLAVAVPLLVVAAPASASPVCTDGYKGGPPRSACGDRIFPEASIAKSYVQFTPDPSGFAEYQHGLEYLASQYKRWISVFTLRSKYGKDAVSAGPDKKRPYEAGDTGDGRDIPVV